MLPLPKPLIISDRLATSFSYPRSKNYKLDESWELGGIALSDPSQELTDYIWYGWTDGTNIYCKREDLPQGHLLLSDTHISEIDLTFDQNMHPCVAFVADGVSKLYWYDAQQAKQVTTAFDGISTPRVSLDDKRRFNVANSDIIFGYQKGNQLCYRVQRERYGKEYTIATDTTGKKKGLWRIGMGKNNRFLFYWR